MQKGFLLIRPTDWQLPFLYQLCSYQSKKIFHALFKRYLHENQALDTTTVYINFHAN